MSPDATMMSLVNSNVPNRKRARKGTLVGAISRTKKSEAAINNMLQIPCAMAL